MINIAALRGSVSEYEILDRYNVLLRKDGRHTVISMKLFNELYLIVNQFGEAALKTDCIEFAEHIHDKPIEYYPEWYQFAVKCYIIFQIGGEWMFYTESGEIGMSPNSIVLRNSRGDLHYMEKKLFNEMYQV